MGDTEDKSIHKGIHMDLGHMFIMMGASMKDSGSMGTEMGMEGRFGERDNGKETTIQEDGRMT